MNAEASSCDRRACDRTATEQVVYLNPNIVTPLYADREGWRHPMFCAPHARGGRSMAEPDGHWWCINGTGRYRIEPGARIAGRMDEAEDPCVTCDRAITAEMRRLWCEHGDPRAECPDCAELLAEATR